MYIVAGKFRHRRLVAPKGAQTRPTASRLRESLFNICQGYIEGASFLDLFAGSGAVGLEALSRGAQSVVLVDKNREAISCMKENIASLKVESQAKVYSGDVFAVLKTLVQQKKTFDIIYADPPYGTLAVQNGLKGHYSDLVIQWVDAYSLLAEGGTLFIEEEAKEAPCITSLKSLYLADSRVYGHSVLQTYAQSISNS